MLSITGITPSGNALPCQCQCAFCLDNLTICEDVSATGQWFYCKTCGEAGDMIELTAAYLGLSLEKAISLMVRKKIIDEGVSGYERKLNDYIMRTVGLRKKLAEFWKKCKKNSSDFLTEHMQIAARLNFNVGTNWSTVGSQLIGFSTKDEAANALTLSERAGGPNSGCNRPFPGEGWNHICVIPAFDMPGRIKTFTFIGPTNQPELQVSVRHIAYKFWGKHDNECGTVFLEEAVRSESKDIIISGGMFETIRLVLDYASKHNSIPPVVTIAEDNSRSSVAWKLLRGEGKTVTAIGDKAEHILASSSAIQKGESPGDWEATWMGPMKWINKVIETSKRNESPVVETSPLKCGVKITEYGGRKYEERVDGVYCGEEIVCDALLRIEKISIEDKNHFYHGLVRCGGEEATFKEKTSMLDNKYSHWVKQFCIKNDLSIPVCSFKYGKAAAKVAMLLHPPSREIVTSMAMEAKSAYRFSSYDISLTGEVIKAKKKRLNDGAEALKDEPFSMFEKGALEDEGAGLAWAAIICCMANAIAYSLKLKTVGIAVDPECFESVKVIAEGLGCYVNKLGGLEFAKSVITTSMEYEADMHLPVIVAPLKANASKKITLERVGGPRNCIMPMERLPFLGCRTISRWVYISQSTFNFGVTLLPSLSKVALNFLPWLITSEHKASGTDLIAKTIDALEKWCEHEGIQTHGLIKGAGLINSDLERSQNRSISDAVVELCSVFIAVRGFNSYEVRGSGLLFPDKVWVPCRELFNMCKSYGVPIAEPGRITQALISAKAILDCRMHREYEVPAWVIDPKKWEAWSSQV